jgi:hypothetical protein
MLPCKYINEHPILENCVSKFENTINIGNEHTRIYVASRESSRSTPRKDARIVSPASESTWRILPHSSIDAEVRACLTVAMRASNRVANATAMPLMRFCGGLIGLFGRRRTQDGSIYEMLDGHNHCMWGGVKYLQVGSLYDPGNPCRGARSASSSAML